jgi:hypothetical protein
MRSCTPMGRRPRPENEQGSTDAPNNRRSEMRFCKLIAICSDILYLRDSCGEPRLAPDLP